MSDGDMAVRTPIARPLYTQVREIMLDRIDGGAWEVGSCLPNEHMLSNEFGVSIGTIRKAVDGLEKAGVLVRKQGRGTYLAGGRREMMASKLCRLRTASGQIPKLEYELAGKFARLASAQEAFYLQCHRGADVVQIDQSVVVNGRIAGVETVVVRAQMFPSLLETLAPGQDLYLLFAALGYSVERAEDRVSVASFPHQFVSKLGGAGDPALLVERSSFGIRSVAIETRRSWFLPDLVSYACC